MKHLFRSTVTCLVAAGFFVMSFEDIYAEELPKAAYSCIINPVTGVSDCVDRVEVLGNENGKARAVISACRAEGTYTRSSEIEFLVSMGDRPNGWLLNIGDSITNNGYGGDWGAQQYTNPWKSGQITNGQSRDAEIQLNGDIRGDKQSWSVWGNDYTQNALDGYRRLFAESNMDFANKTVRVVVKNEGVEMSIVGSSNPPKVLNSPYLFALRGQPDFQGPTNCDVYVGINRVIDGLYRVGQGVLQVTVNIYDLPTSNDSLSLVSELLALPEVLKVEQVISKGIVATLTPKSYTKIAHNLSSAGVDPESVNILMMGDSARSRQLVTETMRAQGLIATTEAPTQSALIKALRRFQRRLKIPRVSSPEMAAELLIADKVGDVK